MKRKVLCCFLTAFAALVMLPAAPARVRAQEVERRTGSVTITIEREDGGGGSGGSGGGNGGEYPRNRYRDDSGLQPQPGYVHIPDDEKMPETELGTLPKTGSRRAGAYMICTGGALCLFGGFRIKHKHTKKPRGDLAGIL